MKTVIVIATGAEQNEKKVFSKQKEKIFSSTLQRLLTYYEGGDWLVQIKKTGRHLFPKPL